MTTDKVIYYDGTCGFCSATQRRFARLLERRGYRFVPLQDPDAVAIFGPPPAQTSGEMKLRTSDGRTLGGADALVEVSRTIWWAWPIYAIGKRPGGMRLLRRWYGWFARNRTRITRTCKLRPNIGPGR